MSFRYQHGDRPLEGYTIQRGVGRGGFGEVYHALSDGGKEVALKYLRDNPQVELRGVMHCLNLKSPHLITLYDVKQNNAGDWFVVMEYVSSGVSLRDLLMAEPRGLGVDKAVYFLREIARGLAYLHSRGIVHRDLKPGNIFFDEGYVKIGDYGLSKAIAASRHSGQTMSVGTVHYMAPEIGSGDYNKTIDLYALGVMLYEMLLGRVPFEGASMGEILMKHLTAQPEVDELPSPFPAVIRRALAKDPAARYQSVDELISEVMGNPHLAQSMAGFDSMSLTRVAERAAAGMLVGAGGGGTGSSNSVTLDAREPRLTSPPPQYTPAGGRITPAAHAALTPNGRAGDAIMNAGTSFPPRSRLVAGLLGIILGPLGVHRFYLGYNGIGILQIAASMTGIGALWGIIEGIIILANGQFTDFYGRPLTGGVFPAQSVPTDGRRATWARVLWGIAATLTAIGAIAASAGATFGGPDMGQISMGLSFEPYYIDTMRFLFMFASALGAFSCFATWKAGHRAGLPPWRATIRPALMCAMLALGGIGLTFDLAIAAGSFQLIGIAATVLAMVGFTALWLMPGPVIQASPDDAHWNLSWLRAYQVLAVVAIIFMAVSAIGWVFGEGTNHPFVLTERCTLTPVTMRTSHWNASEHTYMIPVTRYRHEPLAILACGLAVLGSVSEVVRRRRGAL